MEKKKVWLEKKLKNNLKIHERYKKQWCLYKISFERFENVIKLKDIMTDLIKSLKRKFCF